jgi:DNA-binding transcriptional MerR regulator
VRVPSDAPIYPMKTVVRLTGVEPHRIRFWETKYGLLRPARDDAGRRLYSKDDVKRIKKIGSLVDRYGLSLATASQMVRGELA